MKFVAFMTSVPGRLLRVTAGVILMAVGFFVVQGTPGTLMSGIALLPMAAGILDFCTVGALMGYPLRGAQARERIARERSQAAHLTESAR